MKINFRAIFIYEAKNEPFVKELTNEFTLLLILYLIYVNLFKHKWKEKLT